MATQRGRRPGFVMSDEHRVKIQNSNILNALIEHIEGARDMSSTQVSAGLGLLRKVMPDLSSTTIGGDPDAPIKTEDVGLSELELARRIAFALKKAKVASGA